MIKFLQDMLAKCVNREQSNRSQHLPNVLMAYRSSMQESTGYTPQFLLFGQELSLSLDSMYPKSQENHTSDILDFVHYKQQAFKRLFELVRWNLNEKRKRRVLHTTRRFTAEYTKKSKMFCCVSKLLLWERLSKSA